MIFREGPPDPSTSNNSKLHIDRSFVLVNKVSSLPKPRKQPPKLCILTSYEILTESMDNWNHAKLQAASTFDQTQNNTLVAVQAGSTKVPSPVLRPVDRGHVEKSLCGHSAFSSRIRAAVKRTTKGPVSLVVSTA